MKKQMGHKRLSGLLPGWTGVMLVLALTLGLQISQVSAAITYNSEEYIGGIFGEWDAGANLGLLDVTDILPAPPVDVSVHTQEVNAWGQIPDSSTIGGGADGIASGSDDYVLIDAGAGMELNFTATFPAIRISFDYALDVAGQGNSLGSETTAAAAVGMFLDDSSGISFNYVNEFFVDFSGIDTDSILDSGNFDETIFLTMGADYDLELFAAGFIDLFDNASGHGYAEIMNLNIEAVPVPPTLLLLGSGLIVLVSFKRKSQKV